MHAPTHAERRLARALIALSAVFTLVSTQALFALAGLHESHHIVDGSWLRQLQYGSLFAAAAWLAWRRRDEAWAALLRVNPFLLGVLALGLASALWSAAPDITVKRIALVVGLVLIGTAAGPPLVDARQLLRTVLATLTVLAALSAAVAVAAPSVGTDLALGGAWRGILWHKNMLGSICAFCTVLWLWAMLDDRAHPGRCLAGLLFSVFVLVMARSSTALLVAAAGSAIYLLLRRRYWADRHVLPAAALLCFVAALVGLHFFYVYANRLPTWDELAGPVTALFNKSTDLTGRSELWDLVLLSVAHRPWLGVGYGAFWLGAGGPSQYIADALHWMPLTAHNGYLDILNELGAAGLALMAGMLVWHLAQLARLMRVDRPTAAVHLGLLALMAINNFSESELLKDVLFQNIFFIYSSTAVSATLHLHRRRAAPAPAPMGLRGYA